jgi:hypothetical protein
MRENCTVRCQSCGSQRQENFSECLRTGWPACCGETMSVVSDLDRRMISDAVGDAMAPLAALRDVLTRGRP